MTIKRDPYDILGVSKNASGTEIKKAYRQKALEYHPDRNKAADAEDKFKEINEAYEILSDPQKKQAYDQFGHSAFDPSSGGPFSRSGQASGPYRYTYYTSGSPADFSFDFSDPFDIFETFFGSANPFRSGPQKPHYSIKVSFLDAALGAEKTILHQGKQYKIKVPAGASDGTRIRFSDFDVSFNVEPHHQFQRDGYDIFIDYPISLTTAVLGGQIHVPSLEGDHISLKIRPGTQPGSVIRLSGKGVKHLNSARHGDFYVKLRISIPKKLNRRQKILFQELAQTLK